ncbi:hypothetical protein AB4Y42_34615 [Paraburkholderia sp. EG286B]|uniref:hypothetical protein n=1 Tax=Paraburkholderia sp. EG286B TaxID=3237011 RepID=UPI0034D2F20C
MSTLGYLGLATMATGCVVWTMTAVAKRYDAHFSAPANDVSGSDGGAAAARLPHGVSMTSIALRQGLPEIPVRMRALPLDSGGYPVPYFVARIDGKPDFRIADTDKFATCIYYKRCWICGTQLGQYKAFVIGPTSAVSRTSGEPPCHIECAKFAAQVCPFIVNPRASRRDSGMPVNKQAPAGTMFEHNPGVALVWVTRDSMAVSIRNGVIFRMGEPEQTFWYREGRLANRDEVKAALETGLPALYDLAHDEGEAAVLELDTAVARATRYFPPYSTGAAIAMPS